MIQYHTIIVGSGAAGLNCAVELNKRGIPAEKILIITESLKGGTSHEAGSDKQTYYRLSLYGEDPESPKKMARSLYNGGSMHGDIALIEANCSIQAFMNLINLGVTFPHDKYGAYIGYKTDNDELQRGTSIGPLTSRMMHEKLLEEAQKRQIKIIDQNIVIEIVKNDMGNACGIISINMQSLSDQSKNIKELVKESIKFYKSDFVVLAVGGPAGIYQDSVYPLTQTGATSLAVNAGAVLQNLTELQYGIASLKFRWNLSGSYQQVIPRYISSSQNQGSDENPKEFLRDYFPSDKSLYNAIFLKGYQWPFNPERIANFGSSLVDMAVHIERIVKKRKVYIDFLHNPANFSFDSLEVEARSYLEKSGAIQSLPIDRLRHMNPKAIEIFRSNGIDLEKEPLEIGICAQHSNGGVKSDIWWQTTVPHLFAVGEINGSHGVHRPGGSALNAGQVGGIRIAEKIVNGTWSLNNNNDNSSIPSHSIQKWTNFFLNLIPKSNESSPQNIEDLLLKAKERMSRVGSYIRERSLVLNAIKECEKELNQFTNNVNINQLQDIQKTWHYYDCLITQLAYLRSILVYIDEGGGSRGAYIVIEPLSDQNPQTSIVHPLLKDFPIRVKSKKFEDKILEIKKIQNINSKDSQNDFLINFDIKLSDRRPIPEEKGWFENIWKQFDDKEIFK